MVFYTFGLKFYSKMGKTETEYDTFLRKKTEEKQNIATIMKSADGKGIFLAQKLKLQWESFEYTYLKREFKKDLMNSIEANRQINMTSDHSITQESIITFKQ